MWQLLWLMQLILATTCRYPQHHLQMTPLNYAPYLQVVIAPLQQQPQLCCHDALTEGPALRVIAASDLVTQGYKPTRLPAAAMLCDVRLACRLACRKLLS